jgi:hypothetical protein
MPRRPHWLSSGGNEYRYYCILRFPDSTENRWFSHLPTPGTRIWSHGGHWNYGRIWVVDEVLQSGRDTFTVHLVSRNEFLERRQDRKPDLAADLLELARHTSATVSERRHRWKYRR